MRYGTGRAGLPGTENRVGGRRWPVVLAAIATAAGLAAVAAPAGAATAPATATPKVAAVNSFVRTKLIASSPSLGAKVADKNLAGASGLAAGPGTPIWVSDSSSGFASVYNGGVEGSAVKLQLTVRVPGGSPVGQVFVPPSARLDIDHAKPASEIKLAGDPKPISNKQYPADFVVATDSIGTKVSGEIAAWDGGSSFVVEDSPAGGLGGKTPAGAVFKGLAMATTSKAGPELLAADVHNASVDVFNAKFESLNTPNEFRDSEIPAGYTPFGIQNLGGRIYVTYAKQNEARTDVDFGASLGFVDVYTTDGQLIKHLVAGGQLDAPAALALAPKVFGPFGGDLLVGNRGNGLINAFNATTGEYLGPLDNASGHPIAIAGLQDLRFGNKAFGGSSSLVFSAQPGNLSSGVVGLLSPAPRTS